MDPELAPSKTISCPQCGYELTAQCTRCAECGRNVVPADWDPREQFLRSQSTRWTWVTVLATLPCFLLPFQLISTSVIFGFLAASYPVHQSLTPPDARVATRIYRKMIPPMVIPWLVLGITWALVKKLVFGVGLFSQNYPAQLPAYLRTDADVPGSLGGVIFGIFMFAYGEAIRRAAKPIFHRYIVESGLSREVLNTEAWKFPHMWFYAPHAWAAWIFVSEGVPQLWNAFSVRP